MKKVFLAIAGILVMLTNSVTFGADSLETSTKFSGFVGFEGGEVVKGYSNRKGSQLEKIWQERLLYQIVMDSKIGERIRVVLSTECQMSFSWPHLETMKETYKPRFEFYPDRAEGTYSWGDVDKPYLQFGVGYFPYRFNPDVRNLGEFLFRTGTYPAYIVTNFNRPYARLLGMRLSSILFDNFKQDLLLTSETDYPVMDFSLSYIAKYKIADFIDVGAGVSLSRLFPVNEALTTPKTNDKGSSRYIKANGDTAYFSFKATKPTAMLAFDPKKLLPSTISDNLGKDDFRLYGEVCVTGWDEINNYETNDSVTLAGDTIRYPISDTLNYYKSRFDRTLYMVGFNWSTHPLASYTIIPGIASYFMNNQKIDLNTIIAGSVGLLSGFGIWMLENKFDEKYRLDVLNAEVEYFPTRLYVNSFDNILFEDLPYPTLTRSKKRFVSPLKWSFYAKKTFLDRFSIIAQVARDHYKPVNFELKDQEREDVLEDNGDWWYVLRLNVKF